MVNHVIGDANGLSDAASVVNVIERATAPGYRLRHTLAARQAALVPELHGEAHHVVTVGAQHGRNGRGVDSSRHGDGDGLVWHSALSSQHSVMRLARSARLPACGS